MRRWGLGGIVLAVVVLATAAPTYASWSPRVSISPPSQRVLFASDVTVDPLGAATFVWTSFNNNRPSIYTRTRSPGGGMTPNQRLSRRYNDQYHPYVQPRVDGDSSGDAIFVWQSPGAGWVQARERAPDGTLTPVQTLQLGSGRSNVHGIGVAVNPIGDAAFAWFRSVGEPIDHEWIAARTRTADGTLGPLLVVSSITNGTSSVYSDPSIGIDSNGDALIAWSVKSGPGSDTPGLVQTRVLAADGTLGPIRNLTPSGQPVGPPSVAVAPDGRAVIAWTRSDGSNSTVQARDLSIGGATGPTRTLSPRGSDPAVAINPDGDAVVAWSRGRIQAASLAANGTIGPAQTLSASLQSMKPQVAMDDAGNSVIVWQLHPSGQQHLERAQGRFRSATGALGPLQDFSRGTTPRVDLNASGVAAVTWSNLAIGRTQAAFGP